MRNPVENLEKALREVDAKYPQPLGSICLEVVRTKAMLTILRGFPLREELRELLVSITAHALALYRRNVQEFTSAQLDEVTDKLEKAVFEDAKAMQAEAEVNAEADSIEAKLRAGDGASEATQALAGFRVPGNGTKQ